IVGGGEPCGVSGTTLSPESVSMYALLFASTAISRGGTLDRVVPKTVTAGFSATAPTVETELLSRLASSSVGRESPTAVVEVRFCLACVVRRRNVFWSIAATAATLRVLAKGAGLLLASVVL